MKRALVVINFTNAIVNPGDKQPQNDYANFIATNNTFDCLNAAIGAFREANNYVIFVGIEAQSAETDTPSILSDYLHSNGISGHVDCREGDPLIVLKTGDGDFRGARLIDMLQICDITNVYITGVPTDYVVEAVARSAHKSGLTTYIVANACAAASQFDHEKSLSELSKFAQLVNSDALQL